jgi:hypothetical protein
MEYVKKVNAHEEFAKYLDRIKELETELELTNRALEMTTKGFELAKAALYRLSDFHEARIALRKIGEEIGLK